MSSTTGRADRRKLRRKSRLRSAPGSTKSSSRSRKAKQKTAQGPDDWPAWMELLAKRHDPQPLEELLPASQTGPLLWSLPQAIVESETEERIRRLWRLRPGSPSANGQLAQDLERWLDRAESSAADLALGLDCLAWCHALPLLAQILPAAPWCQLLDRLMETAQEAAGIDLADDPLAHQLLAGELPLTLAYLLPELPECRRLAAPASRQLSHGISELSDGEGLLAGRHLALARPLLACWTRSGYLGRSLGKKTFDAKGAVQLDWFLRQNLRLARSSGSPVFSADGADGWPSPTVDAALELTDDAESHFIARHIVPGRDERDLPYLRREPGLSVHSEWAETAILRCDWTCETPQLVITYGGGSIRSEFNCGQQRVWSGSWDPQVTVNGELLRPSDSWDEVCWVSDEDGDYLELQINFVGKRALQRQLFLGRKERFLFVADALVGSDSAEAEITYESTLPLDPKMGFAPAAETREGCLRARRRIGMAMPLSLPEWRVQAGRGELEQTESGLRLRQSQVSRCLFAPLFIDLAPSRFQRQLTWRKLTVAERLETQPDDVAVGYRVQVGAAQWLIYRSLGPRGNRTLLGQNFSGEFVLARFQTDGEIEKLIEIE